VRFTFFGAYDPAYPRNAVIRRGLRLAGVEVRECRASPKFKVWARYPWLAASWLRRARRRPAAGGESDVIFVPEFGQKDVPLAKFLSVLAARPLVFDPLAARYETKVLDRRRAAPDSPAAWWNMRIDRAAFALPDLVLADTETHKSYYLQAYGVRPDKIEVLPLGYDEELFRPGRAPATAGNGGMFTVLFFGSFLPLHGVEVIVEAARLVARVDPSVRFRIIGSGQTLPAVREAAEASGLRTVEFLGWRPASAIPEAIAAADLCLGIFGRTEKARRVVPHKIFQSMGMGRVVITARTPAVEEIFVHGRTIWLCDEPLAASLAGAVLEMRRNPALKEKLSQGGFDLMQERYTSRAVAGRLVEIVRRRFGR
jgi:glycosyltransferase involved in cell wall biosynthesis